MSEPAAQGTAPDWLTVLGLVDDPFAPGNRPEYFYAEPVFLQRLDLLTHLLQFSDSLLVLLGAAGAGKTTLLRELSARAGDNWRVCELRGADISSLDGLMQRLADCIGMEAYAGDAGDLSARVMARCADLRGAMELPVLIIDDAELVPPSLLRSLAGLAGNPGATAQRLRILLSGTPELEGLLAQAGLAPGLVPFVQTLNMPRLNEVQAAAYLLYQMTVAGYAGESPFSATEVRAIAKASEGLPGVMNALAQETLRNHAGLQLGTARGGRQLRSWLPLVLAAVLLGAAAWFWWPGAGPGQSVPATPPRAEWPLPLPPRPATGVIEDRGLPETPRTEEVAETAEEMAPAPPADLTEEAPRLAQGDGGAEPAVALQEAAPEPPALEPEPAPQPQPEPAAQPEPAPAEIALEAAPRTAPAAPVVAGMQGADWIRAQPGSRFTLQLLVSGNQEALQSFVRQHRLQGQLAWFRRQQQGREEYVLLYGTYPGRAAAQADIATLPARVQRDKPWPRSFTSVQDQLEPE
jgi:DamX protein